jgi:ATP-dependent DNA helicase RecG
MALPININELLHGNTVEWDRIELKKGWNPEDIMHSLCAYANDINNWDGGYIIIGVEEESGKAKLPPIGLQIQELDAIQKKLIELGHKISPAYIPVFQPYLINEKHILVVFAPAGDNRPYKAPTGLSEKRTERAMYIKRGSKTIKVKDGTDDERRLLELTARIPFDDRINQTASLDQLNLGLMQNYLREVMSSLYERSTKIPFTELCRHLMIAKGSDELLRPTNAGLLLFNENPDQFFPGARIDVVVHKDEIGKDYSEKIFRGTIIQQIRDVLQFFKANIIEEVVLKSPSHAESIRFFNYPFQAIEEAVVNAVYHKSYERPNPVEIQIHRDKIELLSFPGPMPPIDQTMLRKQRVVARDYRNRKIGGFLKELRLTEGRGTGFPIIHKSLEENGSPPPIFETDKSNTYFLCVIEAHPLSNSKVVQNDDNLLKFRSLVDINSYLSLSVSEVGDRDVEAIKERINDTIRRILSYCRQPRSRDEIFEEIQLYKNTKNFQSHVKPLIEASWLHYTLPSKLTSRDQKYYTTPLGEQLLEIISSKSYPKTKRLPVSSSSIAAIGYDKDMSILEVEFHHGQIYQHTGVSEKVYMQLINSPSIASFYINEIKSNFEFQKL